MSQKLGVILTPTSCAYKLADIIKKIDLELKLNNSYRLSWAHSAQDMPTAISKYIAIQIHSMPSSIRNLIIPIATALAKSSGRVTPPSISLLAYSCKYSSETK